MIIIIHALNRHFKNLSKHILLYWNPIMNGFLISCYPSKFDRRLFQAPFTNLQTSEYHYGENVPCILLSTWGTNSGDMHLARLTIIVFLFLQGIFPNRNLLAL